MGPNRWPFELGRYLNVANFVVTIIVSIIIALALAAICYRWKGSAAAARAAGWTLLAGSVASVLVATFDRPVFTSTLFPSASNWVPFRDILDEWHNVNRTLGMVNIFGNVALFVPTGLLSAMLLRPAWAALLLAPVLSTAIELTQMYTGLSADIDDIILNTTGGTIGILIGLLIRRLHRARSRVPASTSPPDPPRVQVHHRPD